MGMCKCGLSNQYPECDGTHNVTKNDALRQAIIDAYKQWESNNKTTV